MKNSANSLALRFFNGIRVRRILMSRLKKNQDDQLDER